MDSKHSLFTDIHQVFHDASIYTLKLTSPDPDNDDWTLLQNLKLTEHSWRMQRN